MRIHLWLAAVSIAALGLIGLGAGRGEAGSFFGPCCYGARYAYEYPNRAHNVFGCGPCCRCTAWHPTFQHGCSRKNSCGSADGAGIPPGPAIAERIAPLPAGQPAVPTPSEGVSAERTSCPPF